MPKIKLKNSGQSLLEITITIGVAVTIITALAILTLNGIKNTQFSVNQVQATKLAQEGMERVKTIKERDLNVCLDPDDARWSDIWDYPFGTLTTGCVNNVCKFTVEDTGSCTYNPVTGYWLKNTATPKDLGNGFTRQIIIEENGVTDDQLKVTSEVSWTDVSGTHKSQIVTIMAKY